MNLIKTSLGLMLFASALTAHAQKSIKAPAGGKQISNELIGIFFEDISSSADGGLYAELLQNGYRRCRPLGRCSPAAGR